MSKNKQRRSRNRDDADLRFRLAIMGIRLISQNPKGVFTKKRTRLSIFFASVLRAPPGGPRYAPGRGGGVGRPLGVMPGLGGGVGLAVAVGVAVAVAVGVAVAVAVAVGVGLGVGVGVT